MAACAHSAYSLLLDIGGRPFPLCSQGRRRALPLRVPFDSEHPERSTVVRGRTDDILVRFSVPHHRKPRPLSLEFGFDGATLRGNLGEALASEAAHEMGTYDVSFAVFSSLCECSVCLQDSLDHRRRRARAPPRGAAQASEVEAPAVAVGVHEGEGGRAVRGVSSTRRGLRMRQEDSSIIVPRAHSLPLSFAVVHRYLEVEDVCEPALRNAVDLLVDGRTHHVHGHSHDPLPPPSLFLRFPSTAARAPFRDRFLTHPPDIYIL